MEIIGYWRASGPLECDAHAGGQKIYLRHWLGLVGWDKQEKD